MDLVFATHNTNKLKEIQTLLKNTQFNIKGLQQIGCAEDIAETGNTLDENALIKARYVYKKYNINCFSDDTGLEIDALNGEPGVYSARYAGDSCNADDNINKVLQNLTGVNNRTARFKTVIALIINGKEYSFEGKVEGEITIARQGEKGFGYDPIFKPIGYPITFAEMSLEEKNKISHRGKAIKKLISFLISLR